MKRLPRRSSATEGSLSAWLALAHGLHVLVPFPFCPSIRWCPFSNRYGRSGARIYLGALRTVVTLLYTDTNGETDTNGNAGLLPIRVCR
jgi:hypothetical protein